MYVGGAPRIGRPRRLDKHAPFPGAGAAGPAQPHSRSLRCTRRCAPVGGGEWRGPPGLRESQRPVPEGAELQHQVPHTEAVRGRQGDQLQPDVRPGGQGRVSQRHGGPQTEVALQLPLQARNEEGEELPAHLLEHVPEPAGYAPAVPAPPPAPPGWLTSSSTPVSPAAECGPFIGPQGQQQLVFAASPAA